MNAIERFNLLLGMNLYRWGFVASLAFALCVANRGAEQPLKFEEVFNLVRTNLIHLGEAELNQLAAEGLLRELGELAQLGPQATNDPAREAVTRRDVFADSFGYIRVAEVTAGLPRELKAASEALVSTNRLKGLVIDMRYAKGRDYQAAAQTADLFVKEEQPLLKLGGKELRSTAKSSALDLPLAILVNGETRGAAEALAAILRDAEAGLVIGSRTAGEAHLYQTFTLSTGQQLSLGSIPVSLPNGDSLPTEGLRPDISVSVQQEAEREYFRDPYVDLSRVFANPNATNLTASATNRVRPMNEAELVRRHREGISIDPGAELFEDDEQPQVVTDPVLARGLDFLKGVSVLQQFRPL